MTIPRELETFYKAFRTISAGCRRECHCGREFYNPSDEWDWEEGEIESLEKDPNATAVDHSVGTVRFEGKEYVTDCPCWHERARTIRKFIQSHDYEIAVFLRCEKIRKIDEADGAPTVEDYYNS